MSVLRPFSPATLMHNWVEDRAHPNYTTSSAAPIPKTECQIRSTEGAETKIPTFGAALLMSPPPSQFDLAARSPYARDRPDYQDRLLDGTLTKGSVRGPPAPTNLPPGDRFDRRNYIGPDRLYPASTWASLNSSTHFGADNMQPADAKEFKPKNSVVPQRPEVAEVPPVGATLSSLRASGSPRAGRTGSTTGSEASGFDASTYTDRAPSNASGDPLSPYRARWINEAQPAAVTARFTSATHTALNGSVPVRFASDSRRFLAGAVKALAVIRDRAVERLGVDAAWMVARATPARFTLAQMHKFLGGRPLNLPLSVDDGRDAFRQLALEAPSEATTTLLGSATTSSCPVSRDGKLVGDPTDRVEADGEALVASIMGAAASEAADPSTRRGAFVAAAWELLLRLGHGAVTLGLARQYYDPRDHLDVVKHRRVTAAEASERFSEALAYLLAGEPRAAPVAVFKREAAAAAEALLREQVSGGGKRGGGGFGPETPLPHSIFCRYYAFVSAATDNDDDFAATVAACWHLDEAAALLVGRGGPAAAATAATAGRVLVDAAILSPGAIQVRLSADTRSRATGGDKEGLGAVPFAGDGGVPRVSPAKPALTTSQRLTALMSPSAVPRAPPPSPNGLALAHVAVLVTHTDGSHRVVRIPRDRFLRLGDKADLLERVADCGVTNVADVTLDF